MKNIVLAVTLVVLTSSFPAAAAFIDFDREAIETYRPGQDKEGDVDVYGSTISLTGNVWKVIYNDFEITSNTLLNFDFLSTVEGEIHAIGFDDDSDLSYFRTFRVFGSQEYGIGQFDTYALGDGWSSYSINVGDFYTGPFDRMFFVTDDDSGNLLGNSSFRNVQVCELGDCEVPSTRISEPAIYTIFAFGLLGLRQRKSKVAW